MLDEMHYPNYLLQRMDSPNKAWLKDHRMTKEAPYDKLNDKPGRFPEEATRDEIIQFRRERDEELARRRKDHREPLSSQSFGAESKKVRIDFRGATFTLDSTDTAGIARIMKMING